MVHLLTLMSGTAVSQLVALVVSPFLTRLYAPENFGDYALYTASLVLTVPLVSGRYELAIVPAADDEEARALLVICGALSILSATIAAVLLATGAVWIPWLVAGPSAWVIVGALPLGVILVGLAQATRHHALRGQRYQLISTADVVQSSAALLTQLALALATTAGILGLVAGHLVGLFGFLLVLRQEWATGVAWILSCSLKDVWRQAARVAWRHRRFPMFMPWGGLLDVLGQRLPVFLVSRWYGPRFLGQFALADRIVRMPVALLSGAGSQVLFRHLVEPGFARQQAIVHWVLVMTAIWTVPSVLLYSLGIPAFTWLFGHAWEEAGRLSVVMIPYFWGVLAVSPLSLLLVVAGKQALHAAIQLLIVSVSFLSLLAGHAWYGDGRTTIAWQSVGQFLVYLVYLAAIFSACRSAHPSERARTGASPAPSSS